MDLRLNEYIT